MYYYRVKEIYYKLKLDKNIAIHVEEKSKDIEGYIQQMAKVFFTIYSPAVYRILTDIRTDIHPVTLVCLFI